MGLVISSRERRIAKAIVAELSESQKRLTDRYTSKRRQGLLFGEMFKDERTYFPVERGKSFWTAAEPPREIADALDSAGYYMPDYRKNAVYRKTDKEMSSKNPPRLLTVLKKELKNDPQKYRRLEKMFVERKEGASQNADGIKMLICVTHDPYDIAGMSTDRNWTSCMELPGEKNRDGGQYYNTALRQVQYGGMVAYLIAEDDREIRHPYARIAIKRLENETGAFIFKSENVVYGDRRVADDTDFKQELDKILEKSNAETGKDNTMYFRRDNSYSDSNFDYLSNGFDPKGLAKLPAHTIAEFIEKMNRRDKDLIEKLDEIADELPNNKFSAEVVHALFDKMEDSPLIGRDEMKAFYNRHDGKIDEDYLPFDLD